MLAIHIYVGNLKRKQTNGTDNKILTVGKMVKLSTSFKLSTLYSKTCVKRPL